MGQEEVGVLVFEQQMLSYSSEHHHESCSEPAKHHASFLLGPISPMVQPGSAPFSCDPSKRASESDPAAPNYHPTTVRGARPGLSD